MAESQTDNAHRITGTHPGVMASAVIAIRTSFPTLYSHALQLPLGLNLLARHLFQPSQTVDPVRVGVCVCVCVCV